MKNGLILLKDSWGGTARLIIPFNYNYSSVIFPFIYFSELVRSLEYSA